MKLRTNKLLALLLVIVIVFNSADINLISLASDMDNGFNSELILSDDTSNNSTIGNNDPAPDDGYSVTYSYNIPNYKVSDKIAKKLLNSYKNKDIKLPKLSSKGYTFLGWFIDDIKISKISKNNVLCKGNITVEARFAYKPSKVKNAIKPGVSGNIIIDYDGGTSKKTLSSNGLDLNKSVKLPKPKKEGYKFLGWFVGNTKVTKLDYKLDVCMPYNNGETLTCKAKWTPSEVTIKFNKNGSKTKGKIAPYVTYVNAITILPECTLVKDNLKFAYWSTKKKGVGISIPNSGFKINKLGIKLKKTLKLYANYSEEGLKKDDNLGVNITLDTSAFTYNEAGDWYVVDTLVSKLTGKVSKAENIDSFSYVMKDAFGNTVKKADLEAKEKLEINNFGFVVGYNELIFDIEEKNGVCKEQKFGFFNSNEDNQKETDIDFSDTDGDGLDNYYESIIGTNPLKADTDGDMLNDYQELILTGTDPTLSDTDSDGVNDADEDNDEDGLTNINEIKIGTDCKNKDTDGDTLSDGDEVNKYKTNPLLWDTDGDGLSDGQEVELKYDPNKSDTDGNGIKDADETKYQTYEEKIENEEHPGVSQVSISLDSDGYLGEKATIMDTYNLDMRSTELAGLIGSPVDIEYDGTFDSAELVFTYDESKLGDTSEEDLALMWYDEANDQYVFLDSELDTVKNTVSYKTTHFSSYMLVDKKKTLKAFSYVPNYRGSDNAKKYDMVFVVDASGRMSE